MDVGTKIDNRPVSETEQDKDIVKIGVLSTWVPTKVAHGLAFILSFGSKIDGLEWPWVTVSRFPCDSRAFLF